jgi:hypothetical protein
MAGTEIGMTKAPSLGCRPSLPARQGPWTVPGARLDRGTTAGPQVPTCGFRLPA